jgi:hypothetical protein
MIVILLALRNEGNEARFVRSGCAHGVKAPVQ